MSATAKKHSQIPSRLERLVYAHSWYHISPIITEYGELADPCLPPEYEAIWIHFESICPFTVKVHIGGINAISGEPLMESSMRRKKLLDKGKSVQDYAIVDPADQGQLWLDGIAKYDGMALQFVAASSGSGYSVESQIQGNDSTGGIQIFVTPIKAGTPTTVQINQLQGRPIHVKTNSIVTVYDFVTQSKILLKHRLNSIVWFPTAAVFMRVTMPG